MATNVTFLTVALQLLDLAIKIVALGLVPEGRRPSSATAWLLLILFLPVIGILAFWLIGSPLSIWAVVAGRPQAIAAMAREVRTAERYVHVECYIMSWDSTTNDFFEALAEVAARGVNVRLMAPPATGQALHRQRHALDFRAAIAAKINGPPRQAARTVRRAWCRRRCSHVRRLGRSVSAPEFGTRGESHLAPSCTAQMRADRWPRSAP